MLDAYQRSLPNAQTVQASFLDTGLEAQSFDAVVIVGGLHHLQPRIADAFAEAHRIIKPNGYFLFVEPETGTLPDVVRKLWYKLDSGLFESNEAAIDLKAILLQQRDRFDLLKIYRSGGPAYFLTYNSLVLRIPLGLKNFIAPSLLKLDHLVDRILPRFLTSFAVVQLRRR